VRKRTRQNANANVKTVNNADITITPGLTARAMNEANNATAPIVRSGNDAMLTEIVPNSHSAELNAGGYH
jgi:hypothetical protein